MATVLQTTEYKQHPFIISLFLMSLYTNHWLWTQDPLTSWAPDLYIL